MFIVTLLLLTMSWSQVFESPKTILSEEPSSSNVGTSSKSTFSNGASELSADVGTNPSASIPLEAGYRLDHGSMNVTLEGCLLYTSPSPRDRQKSRMPSSA